MISRKWTLLPAVTDSVPPPWASSIELMGSFRSKVAVCESVRRSHHLIDQLRPAGASDF